MRHQFQRSALFEHRRPNFAQLLRLSNILIHNILIATVLRELVWASAKDNLKGVATLDTLFAYNSIARLNESVRNMKKKKEVVLYTVLRRAMHASTFQHPNKNESMSYTQKLFSRVLSTKCSIDPCDRFLFFVSTWKFDIAVMARSLKRRMEGGSCRFSTY